MSDSPMAEQEIEGFRFRSSSRIVFPARVDLRYDRREPSVGAQTIDVSLEGMFVRSDDLRPVGTLVHFELDAGAWGRVQGLGDVIWVRSQDDDSTYPRGMGIQFRYLDTESRSSIRSLVSSASRERTRSEPVMSQADASLPEGMAVQSARLFEPAASNDDDGDEATEPKNQEGLGPVSPMSSIRASTTSGIDRHGAANLRSSATGDLGGALPAPEVRRGLGPGGRDETIVHRTSGRVPGAKEAGPAPAAMPVARWEPAPASAIRGVAIARRPRFPLRLGIVVAVVILGLGAVAAIVAWRNGFLDRFTDRARGRSRPATTEMSPAPIAVPPTIPPGPAAASSDLESAPAGDPATPEPLVPGSLLPESQVQIEQAAADSTTLPAGPSTAKAGESSTDDVRPVEVTLPGARPLVVPSRIVEVTVTDLGTSTLVRLVGDRPFGGPPPIGTRFDAPPRVLVRLPGIGQRIVGDGGGTGLLRRMRSGVHSSVNGPELHVVFDLVHAGVQAQLSVVGGNLEVRFQEI